MNAPSRAIWRVLCLRWQLCFATSRSRKHAPGLFWGHLSRPIKQEILLGKAEFYNLNDTVEESANLSDLDLYAERVAELRRAFELIKARHPKAGGICYSVGAAIILRMAVEGDTIITSRKRLARELCVDARTVCDGLALLLEFEFFTKSSAGNRGTAVTWGGRPSLTVSNLNVPEPTQQRVGVREGDSVANVAV